LHGAEADVVAGVFETRAKILLEAGGEFMRGFPGLGMNDVAEMNAYPDGEPGRGQEGDALGEIASLALDQDGLNGGSGFHCDESKALLEGVHCGGAGAGSAPGKARVAPAVRSERRVSVEVMATSWVSLIASGYAT
jgi:hypothetical protein